jgi:hypothetical protein
MDKSEITFRVEEIRRELAAIREANRIYKTRSSHNRLEMDKHEKRRQRLQEIVLELGNSERRVNLCQILRRTISQT